LLKTRWLVETDWLVEENGQRKNKKIINRRKIKELRILFYHSDEKKKKKSNKQTNISPLFFYQFDFDGLIFEN